MQALAVFSKSKVNNTFLKPSNIHYNLKHVYQYKYFKFLTLKVFDEVEETILSPIKLEKIQSENFSLTLKMATKTKIRIPAEMQ